MRIISFDPFPLARPSGTKFLKPERLFIESEIIQTADWVIFPETWQVNVLHYIWKKAIFPNIQTYHLGYDKISQTRAMIAACPKNVPYTLILPNTPASADRILDELSFPFVMKKVRSARGEGVFLIRDRGDFYERLAKEDILYAQEYLPVERDMRVVWFGDEIVTAYWRRSNQNGFHTNVAQGGHIELDEIPEDARRLVETTAKALGVNCAGFDLAMIGEHYFFWEFNVKFGNQGLSRQGIDLSDRLLAYLMRNSFLPIKPLRFSPLPKAS